MADVFRSSLFLAHRKKLIDYAAPIVGSRDQAEDIVQEAFLHFVPSKPAAGDIEQPLSYLYRIVRNRALDRLRRNKTAEKYSNEAPAFWSVPRPVATPEEAILHAEDLKAVAKVLAELPNHTRIAVEMHRFGGYTLDEIAAYLDLPLATVHRMIRKALLQIAAHLRG